MSGENGVSITARIEAARRQGDAAFDLLLKDYRNYLRFLARDGVGVALRSKVDISDIAHDILVRAAGRFDQFRGTTEAELLAWLRKMLANHLIDLAKKYRMGGGRPVVHERSIEDALYESSQAFAHVLALSGTSPSDRAVRHETAALIADALAELSEDHQEVISLRTMRGLEWEEVGQRMGRSYDAVRQLWVRALKALRPRLEDIR